MIFQLKLKPGKGKARCLECLIHLFSIKITVLIFNPLSDNLAKWTDISNNSLAKADELFECVWPFCGVSA